MIIKKSVFFFSKNAKRVIVVQYTTVPYPKPIYEKFEFSSK